MDTSLNAAHWARRTRGPFAALALGLCLFLASGAGAADRYWVGTSGSWATLSNWSTNPDNPTPNPAAIPNFDDLFFNISSVNGNTVIDLNAARGAESLNFTNTGSTQFRGNSSGTTARTLTISPRGITMAPGAGAVTIGAGNGSVNLSFSGSQNITNNSSSSLFINNNVAGSGTPTLTNNGTGSNYVGMGVLQATVGKVVQNSATSTLGLRNNNTAFTGDVEILKGTVAIGNSANNLGSATAGKVVLGGSGSDAATIEINDNQNITYNARPIVLGTTTGTLKIVLRDENGGSFTHTMTGAISGPNSLTLESRAGSESDDKLVFTTGGFNNAGTITHIGDSAADLTISSVIGPLVTGVIQNSATSKLVLSGANTYAGNTTVSAGTLVITSTAALPGFDTVGRYSVASGGALTVTNAIADADVATILGTDNFASGGAIGFDTAAGDREYAAAIADAPTGGLGLVKQGANTLTLSGINSYTGTTRIEAGTLSIATAAALPGSGTPGRYSVSSGAVLAVVNAVTDPEVAAILGTGNIASGGSIGFDTTAGNRTYAAAIADPPAGGLGLVKLGGNALTLSGVNTYTGNTRVAAGTLVITSAAALPGWNTPGRYSVSPGAALAVPNSISDADVATILGTGNIAAGGAIGFDTSAGDRTYSGTIADPPTGGLGLFKLGVNTLTLGAANTFTGPTRSVAGTLAVADAFALGGSTLDMAATDSGSVTFGQDSTLGGLSGARDLDLGGRTVSVGSNNQSTAYSGGLSNGSLAKIGTGLLTLSGVNTYAGGTTVSAGTLAIASSAALPGFDTAGRYSVASGAVLSVANEVIDEDVSAILATGNIQAGGVIGFDTTAGDRTTPAIAGDIGLRKTGANTLSLAAEGNTYSGPTTVAAGTLRIPGTQTIASNVRAEAGAQLHLDGDVTMTGPVRWQGGDGLRALSGTSVISGPMSLGNINGNILNVAEGAQLTINGNITGEGTASRFFVAGSGEVIVNGTIEQLSTALAGGMQGPATLHLLGANQFTGPFNVGVGTVVVNTLYNPGFESSLGLGTTSGGGVTNMTSTAGAQESTLRYIGEETSTSRQVRLQSNIAGARSVIESSGTGSLRFSNDAFNVADTNTSRAPQTLVLSGTNNGVIEGRIVNNSTTSVISLVKEGSGTWELGDPTTFTGTTTITAGTLAVRAPGGLQTSPRVTVEAGATFRVIPEAYTFGTGRTLAGDGTVDGSVVLGTGATLSPGSSPGTLTVTQNVTLSGGGNYNWQVYDAAGTAGSSTGWDLLSVGGALDIAATAESRFNLNLWSLSGVGPDANGAAVNFNSRQNGSWKIASAAGGITGFAADKFAVNTAAANGTAGFANDLAGGTFAVVQQGNDLLLQFTAGSGPAPDPVKITGVYMKGSTWNAGYLARTPFSTVEGATVGWELPDGSAQLANASNVAWNNVDTITVQFDQPIAQPDAAALQLVRGTASGNQTIVPTLAPTLLGDGSVAQWTLPASFAELQRGKYVISIAGEGITNTDGTAILDGDWITSVSTFAQGSGDGQPGGAFNFFFNSLVGDVNGDGVMNAGDLSSIRSALTSPLNTPLAADSSNYRLDIDGLNSLNSADLSKTRAQLTSALGTQLASLPAVTAPTALGGNLSVAAVPEPGSFVLLAGGFVAGLALLRRRQ
jgi:fibronectin-binding autotransporter adhesin